MNVRVPKMYASVTCEETEDFKSGARAQRTRLETRSGAIDRFGMQGLTVAQERGGGDVGALRGRGGLNTARCSLNLLRGLAKWLARILP